MKYAFVTLALALGATARPSFSPSFTPTRRAAFTEQNGKDAIALNNKFKALTAASPCNAGENACVNDQFAQCVGGKFVLQPCGATLVCAALPLVNSAGTSITCTTAADRDARIAATGATAAGSTGNTGSAAAPAGGKGGDNAANGNAAASSAAATAASTAAAAAGTAAAAAAGGDPQTSLTIDPSNIFDFSLTGQETPTPGQEASVTSKNNFINFCLTVPGKQKTNGKQIIEGSCNQTPMGVIAAKALMPSAKFVNPKNGDTVKANTNFTVKLAINNLETGHFTNPDKTFHMAPQQVNAQGLIKGHSHITIEKLQTLAQTTPTDPTKFVFFKGLNSVAQNGVLSVEVGGGLPAGAYRIATINSAANHQPALVAVAQRGTLDDMAYFTVA